MSNSEQDIRESACGGNAARVLGSYDLDFPRSLISDVIVSESVQDGDP